LRATIAVAANGCFVRSAKRIDKAKLNRLALLLLDIVKQIALLVFEERCRYFFSGKKSRD